MLEPEEYSESTRGRPAARPWTLAGGPDPDFDERARHALHASLTDPSLARAFRARFGDIEDAEYDEMVRALGYIWDCPRDGAANVTGYRCAGCGRTRASTLT